MNQKTKEKLWSLSYVLVLLAIFAANITMTMLMPVIPLYLKSIGQTPALSGIVISVFTFAALFCRPFSGWLLDNYSKKMVLLIGGVLITGSCLSYQFISSIVPLLILRIVHGIGYSAATNAAGTMAANQVPPSRYSEGLGYYGAAFAVSLALGPALALTILNSKGINTVFQITFVIGLFGAGAALLLTKAGRPEPQPLHQPETDQPSKLISSMIEKKAVPASIVMIPISIVYIAIMSFLPSYGISLGLGGLSTFFLIYAGALLLCRGFVGKYTDKHGMTGVLLPGIFILALTYVVLYLSTDTISFMTAAIFFGIGYGIVQPTLNAIAISGAPYQRRGAASATFFGAMDIGLGIGAIVWGSISGIYGYRLMYGWCILIVLIAGGCCYFLINRNDN